MTIKQVEQETETFWAVHKVAISAAGIALILGFILGKLL